MQVEDQAPRAGRPHVDAGQVVCHVFTSSAVPRLRHRPLAPEPGRFAERSSASTISGPPGADAVGPGPQEDQGVLRAGEFHAGDLQPHRRVAHASRITRNCSRLGPSNWPLEVLA